MDRTGLKKQLSLLLAAVAVFAAFNAVMYLLMTRRLSNNFSGATQAKMIDLRAYLPHQQSPDLVRIESSLKLTDDLPVLDGATALVPVYASVIENVYPADAVTYEGGTFSDDSFNGENFAADSKMQYNNTVRGYRAIVDGTTDILFCAAPSEEQRQYAADKGVELISVPIGLEAFVFFVNKNNPVGDLTEEQIRGIYAGKYTDWAELGGAHRSINPVTRIQGSGSQSAMDSFLGGTEIAAKSPFAVTGASIGFSFRYYLEGIVGNKDIKILSLNGVGPSEENIRNRTYPLVVPFYAVYRADNTNGNIQALIGWLLSDEGQEIIERAGYVSITP